MPAQRMPGERRFPRSSRQRARHEAFGRRVTLWTLPAGARLESALSARKRTRLPDALWRLARRRLEILEITTVVRDGDGRK